jgi:hypothetical protein
MAVVLVLCLLVGRGTASGLETLPESTAPPTISPASPLEDQVETATQGTWTGSPTSFSYAWYLCSGTASCVSIPGATASTYTPLETQVGSTLRVLVTATNATGSASALSDATAAITSPGPFHWYSCKKVGGTAGAFEDSGCITAKKGPYEWTKVAAATPGKFLLSGSKTFTLGWVESGVQITIGCSGQSGTGELENPSGGGAGTIAATTLKLTGCTFTAPAGKECKVSGGSIQTLSMKGTATATEVPRTVKFQPTSGTTFFALVIEGCTTTFLNGTYTFTGSFGGIDRGSTSALEFTKASTSGLTVSGLTASLQGTLRIETSPAGEALKLTPF